MHKVILAAALAMSAGAAQAQNVPHVTVGIICSATECVEVRHPDVSPTMDACQLVQADRYIALVQQIIRAGLAGTVLSVQVECRPDGVGA
jgi:hypothetical protein